MELHRLGNFLKGAAAPIGLRRVQVRCRDIELLGAKKDTSEKDIDEETALQILPEAFELLKQDYLDIRKRLEKFYRQLDSV